MQKTRVAVQSRWRRVLWNAQHSSPKLVCEHESAREQEAVISMLCSSSLRAPVPLHSCGILASINQYIYISVFNESRSTAKDTDAHSSTWRSLLSGNLYAVPLRGICWTSTRPPVPPPDHQCRHQTTSAATRPPVPPHVPSFSLATRSNGSGNERFNPLSSAQISVPGEREGVMRCGFSTNKPLLHRKWTCRAPRWGQS
jgi:hypothetical protein